MQRVIEQLSETKDPRLFNKKINKLLDLFDKWECNMVEREHALLESAQRQSTQLQTFEAQEQQIQQREKALFEEKQQLEFQLSALNQREQSLIEQRTATAQREALLLAQHQKLQAVLSRITEKDALLAAKKDSFEQRTADFQREEARIAAEKDAVMREWDEVIAQAQSIKRIEQDNQQLLAQLRDTQEKIASATTLLERKYESLHNMHEYQIYKQQIDERESKLRLKEENIRMLQKELAALKSGESVTPATHVAANNQDPMKLSGSASVSSSVAAVLNQQPMRQRLAAIEKSYAATANLIEQQDESGASMKNFTNFPTQQPPSFLQMSQQLSTAAAAFPKDTSLNESRSNHSQRLPSLPDETQRSTSSNATATRLTQQQYQQQPPQQQMNSQAQQQLIQRNANAGNVPIQPPELEKLKDMNQEDEREYLRNLLEKKQRLLQQYEEQSRQAAAARNQNQNKAEGAVATPTALLK